MQEHLAAELPVPQLELAVQDTCKGHLLNWPGMRQKPSSQQVPLMLMLYLVLSVHQGG